ncbi:ATP-binding protein [Staphylococcus haemolyticus]|uniref:ATP-binding protein n=1 Tax=Staphylococcus haemolyticus TaxID=1283 RepID=UPI0028FF8B7E|nr:ATP-binding protein [Staphylococcus haemolyticus]MDU0449995.1 ATP-binding protein [Staphylococcus haemolyticus]MDU0485883.1 ATP-binding protein [Staphylococcus haemolyticus]MDU0491347.1 ATP-binding protein [Staphylococcus haemolyticus]
MNKKTRNENKKMKHAAEKIIVDKELRDRGRDNLEKASYNIDTMLDNVDQQIAMKKELLSQLRQRRNNSNQFKQRDLYHDKILENKLNAAQEISKKNLNLIELDKVTTIDIDREDFDSIQYNREFAQLNSINLDSPFLTLYSKTEQVKIANQVVQQFDLLELDDMDYLFATAAGVIAGFVDVMYGGTIAKGKDAKGLQKIVDKSTEELVKKYALHEKIAKLNKQKKNANSKDAIKEINSEIKKLKEKEISLKSSISYLEKQHPVGYDTSHSKYIEEMTGMSADNHHLLSIAHEPSLLGLIVGIRDQLTGTSTFMTKEGKIINIVSQNNNKELTGNIFEQIIQATDNWFGHIMSDISGSKGSKGRGSGLPVPGWSSLQKLQFGKIPLNGKDMTIAQVSEWMFKNGYDIRAFASESISVIIFETLIRIYWFYKQYFYYGKSLKESIPIANNRELSRLLLIGSATFSSIDIGHGLIKSTSKGGLHPIGIATFIMTVNKPGLLDLGFRSYQNVRFELQHRKHVEKIIETDILMEYRRITVSNSIF